MNTFDSRPLNLRNLNMAVRCECGCALDYAGEGLSTRSADTPDGYRKEKINLTCNSCDKTMGLWTLVKQ